VNPSLVDASWSIDLIEAALRGAKESILLESAFTSISSDSTSSLYDVSSENTIHDNSINNRSEAWNERTHLKAVHMLRIIVSSAFRMCIAAYGDDFAVVKHVKPSQVYRIKRINWSKEWQWDWGRLHAVSYESVVKV
jgi:hypothetical protein